MTGQQALGNTVIAKWKKEIGELLALQTDECYEIDYDELYRQLDQIVVRDFKDIPAILHNNYTMRDTRTSLTQMASCVMDDMCILGGDACLFFKHDKLLSVNVPIIAELKKRRKEAKDQLKLYEDGSFMYVYYDTKQKNIKIIINSLYGVMGYHGFHFYNVNLAKSITAMGRCIISTASCGYENFNAGNIQFVNIAELLHYINNIVQEFRKVYPENKMLFLQIDIVTPSQVVELLRERCAFKFTNDEAMDVAKIISRLDKDCIKMLYYKNNVTAFNNTPLMRRLIKQLFDKIDKLTLGDPYAFENPEKTGTILKEGAYDTFKDFRRAYQVMVQYNYPIYDCVRRTRYTDKKSVLYIDTDSNFISLDPYVRFVCDEIYGGIYNDTYDNMRFKISSVYTMIMSDVVARNFVYFTEMRNIAPEYGQILVMKNEFFFSRIAFGNVKKRYFGWKMLREGKLLKEGKGDLEIKGFDFIKAGTKDTIRKKYSGFVNQILLKDHLNVRALITEALEFKEEVRAEILSGSTMYFKQTTVNLLEHYKKPYSQQGVKGVLLWNALNPDDVLDLPAPIDVIPINLAKGFTEKRRDAIRAYGPRPLENPEFETIASTMPCLLNFAKNYPDAYEKFWHGILNNSNPQIADMEFKTLAKPRHSQDMPEWFMSLIDMEKVIGESVALLTPVLQSTGIKSTKVGDINHYTNIVEV